MTNWKVSIFASHLIVLSALAVPGAGQGTAAIERARNKMVDEEIVAAGVENPGVVQSMRTTPRHEFVPLAQRKYAYFDMALPIGASQTISPPFVVALMTEALDPQPTDRVLEIGTSLGVTRKKGAVVAGDNAP